MTVPKNNIDNLLPGGMRAVDKPQYPIFDHGYAAVYEFMGFFDRRVA